MANPDETPSNLTQFLNSARAGDQSAAEELLPLIYRELRGLAGREFRGQNPDNTLQPTDLVHEAFIRLVRSETTWENRAHFFGFAATAMRRILVDHARARQAQKRGDGKKALDLDYVAVAFEERSLDLVRLDEALTRLAEKDPMKAKLVELRFFAGLSLPDAAEVLGTSRATAERSWALARAWLKREVLRS